jgi:hypothetical protein
MGKKLAAAYTYLPVTAAFFYTAAAAFLNCCCCWLQIVPGQGPTCESQFTMSFYNPWKYQVGAGAFVCLNGF